MILNPAVDRSFASPFCQLSAITEKDFSYLVSFTFLVNSLRRIEQYLQHSAALQLPGMEWRPKASQELPEAGMGQRRGCRDRVYAQGPPHPALRIAPSCGRYCPSRAATFASCTLLGTPKTVHSTLANAGFWATALLLIPSASVTIVGYRTEKKRQWGHAS